MVIDDNGGPYSLTLEDKWQKQTVGRKMLDVLASSGWAGFLPEWLQGIVTFRNAHFPWPLQPQMAHALTLSVTRWEETLPADMLTTQRERLLTVRDQLGPWPYL